MVRRKDVYEAALERKKNSLADKRREYGLLLNAAYGALPRLNEIDCRLSSLGAQLGLSAMSGDKAALSEMQSQITALYEEKKQLLKKARVKDICYDCPLCHDTGYVNGKICRCVDELVRSITLERLSRDMPLSDCHFDNFKLKYYPDTPDENGSNPRKRMTGIFKLCREYVLNFNPSASPNLLFMGAAGLGKTHLTLAIVSGVIDKGFDVIYGSAYNLLTAVENEHFTTQKGDSYETMLECDLLVIDDLGAEYISPFTLSALYGMINSRLLSKRPTIINTNLSMLEIETKYTARIASRLTGEYKAKRFLGSDIRQLKSIEK